MGGNDRAVTASVGQTAHLNANPPQALQPSFTTQRSEGRDESESHITVKLCACARAMDWSRGSHREMLQRALCVAVQYSICWGPDLSRYAPPASGRSRGGGYSEVQCSHVLPTHGTLS